MMQRFFLFREACKTIKKSYNRNIVKKILNENKIDGDMTSIEALKKRQQDLEGRIQRLEKQKLESPEEAEGKQNGLGFSEPNLVHTTYKKELVKIDSANIQDFPEGKGIGCKKLLKGH